MPKVSVDEICSSIIPHLTAEERGKIVSVCKLHGFKGAEEIASTTTIRDEDENFVLFYSTLSELMLSTVGRALPKNVRSLPGPLSSQIRKGWKAVDVLVKRAMPRAGPAKRVKMYQIIILSVVEHINDNQITLTIKTLGQQLENCSGILEKQFPGYLASGLASMLVRWGRMNAELEEGE